MKYEQTIGDIKAAVAKKTSLSLDKLLLFWHGKELTAAFDGRSLLEMNLHTGFSLMGYDLTEKPDFWPPTRQTPDGLEIIPAGQEA